MTPFGVAWPQVSHTHTRLAPASIAVAYSARTCSGVARVVSSVTNMHGNPFLVAKDTASFTRPSIFWKSQSSAYWRIGDEPMKAHTSIGTPVRWTMSTTGSMSLTTVRQATFGRILSFNISFERRSMCSRARGPAPGRPTLAVWMPSLSIRWMRATLSSRSGSRTEGDCRPSRRVSSSNWIVPAAFQSGWFQSWIRASRSVLMEVG